MTLKQINYIQKKKKNSQHPGKKISADFEILFLFPKKVNAVISCKSFPQETICMKCLCLFSEKEKYHQFVIC